MGFKMNSPILNRSMEISKTIEAVIFDLDGVIVSTDEFHAKAWIQLANEEGISLDSSNIHNIRGVSRMESLEIILGTYRNLYSTGEKQLLAERKNRCYRSLLGRLSPADILRGL